MPGRGRSVGRGAEPKARERTPAERVSCSREKRAETLLAEGEVSGGGEEEVVDVAVGSPGLIFDNEDEEGGKVVQMALSDSEGDDRSGVLTWVQEAMGSVVLGDEENRGRRREGES
jgi:hypothetical protein